MFITKSKNETWDDVRMKNFRRKQLEKWNKREEDFELENIRNVEDEILKIKEDNVYKGHYFVMLGKRKVVIRLEDLIERDNRASNLPRELEGKRVLLLVKYMYLIEDKLYLVYFEESNYNLNFTWAVKNLLEERNKSIDK